MSTKRAKKDARLMITPVSPSALAPAPYNPRAMTTEARARLMEIDPAYCDFIRRRYAALVV